MGRGEGEVRAVSRRRLAAMTLAVALAVLSENVELTRLEGSPG